MGNNSSIITVKPSEWKYPAMQTEYAKGIVSKLEKHFGRPMFGSINMGGIDIEYADPDAVIQMMAKLERQEGHIQDETRRLKELYKTLAGHEHT